MSNSLNLCQFIGRLGQDPSIKYMPSGDAVANVSIAVGWKSKDKEGVEWVPLVFFGKLAEIVGKYLEKGSQVYVSGKFRTRKWEDKEGVSRYTTEIIVNDLQMLGSKPTANSGQVSNSQPNSAGNRYEQGAIDAMQTDAGGDPFDDEIPFAAKHWMEG